MGTVNRVQSVENAKITFFAGLAKRLRMTYFYWRSEDDSALTSG